MWCVCWSREVCGVCWSREVEMCVRLGRRVMCAALKT